MEHVTTSPMRISTDLRPIIDLSEDRRSPLNELDPGNVSSAPVKAIAKRRSTLTGSRLIRSKMHPAKPYLAFFGFASISITIAVLVVYFTRAAKQCQTCSIMYQGMATDLLYQNSRPRSIASGDFNGDAKIDIVIASSAIDSITIFLGNGNGNFPSQTTYPTGKGSQPYSVAVGDFNNDSQLDIVVANYGTHSIDIFLGYGNGTFILQMTYSTSISQPLVVLAADVNNDDRSDIIVVHYGTNTVGIILGYNNGTFSNQMLYSTGYDSLPYSAAVGDFNNDTRLDIAIANYDTYTLGILLGYGDGTFAPQQTYFIGNGSRPYSVAVGDFNKDNKLDIAVANSETGTISIFFGYGNGMFANNNTFLTNIYGPQYIAVADINNDNLQDILLSNNLGDSICIFQSSNNGTFGSKTTHSTGVNSNPYSFVIGDLNNDKRLDIIVVNNGTNNVGIMLAYDPGNFLNQTTYSTEYFSKPMAVAVGDFNNDSRLDVVVGDYDGSNIGVFLADSDGGFSTQSTYSVGSLSFVNAVAVADFDNDSRLDIAVSSFSDRNVAIFFGYGDGTFGNRTRYSAGGSYGPQSIAIGDVNNDSRLDMVFANYQNSNIGVFLGIGNRQFTNQTTYTTADGDMPSAVALGDFNNDNRLDFIFAYSAGFDSKIVIFFGLGDGTFVNPITYATGSSTRSYSVAVGDFNNDSKLDIAVTTKTFRGTGLVGIFLGLGNGTFANQMQFSTESISVPISMVVADFNNDKILDMVIAQSNVDNVDLFLGLGDGTFSNQKILPIGNQSSPSAVAFGDFNSDNRLDIIVTYSVSNNIGIFLGHVENNFKSPQTYSTGSATNPHSLIAGDFNRDNQLDIAVANYGTGTVSVLLGYGDITFANEIKYQTGSDSLPISVIVADFNNDSALDIAVANYGNDIIDIFLGYGNGTFEVQTNYSSGSGSRPSSLAVGDFNNDHQSDIVITQYGTDNIGIFLGYRYPDAESQQTFLTGSPGRPCLVAVGDFNNNDNLIDIVVFNVTVQSLSVFLAFGNGSFSNVINSAIANDSLLTSFVVGDFNNDNRLDIGAIDMDTTYIAVFLGYGNGKFAPQAVYSTGASSTSQGIAVGDFNNDNRTDIVVTYTSSQNMGVFLAYSNGSFVTQVKYSNGDDFLPSSITVGDFNSDNYLDILVANDNPTNTTLEIFLGYGNGTFINKTAYSILLMGRTVTSIAVGDFNNDKQPDIVVCYRAVDLMGIFLANGSVNFAPEKTYSLKSNSKSQSLSIGDFNNDNRLDIVVTFTNTDSIGLFLGFGDGTFELVRQYSTGQKSGPYSIALADLNHDYVLDIIVGNSYTGSIGILFGFCHEVFFRQLLFATGSSSGPRSVAIGDLNNDTRQDIVVVNSGTDNIGIFLGYGDGTFENQTTYSTSSGSRPYSVAVGDLNSDNQLDIVVANYGTGTVGVLLGYSDGTFASQITYSTGSGSRPSSIAILDFDNDNRLDIAVSDEGTSYVIILFGYGNGTFGMLTKYATGYNSQPCAIAIGDFNNDLQMDITVANCGTNNIGFISKFC